MVTIVQIQIQTQDYRTAAARLQKINVRCRADSFACHARSIIKGQQKNVCPQKNNYLFIGSLTHNLLN